MVRIFIAQPNAKGWENKLIIAYTAKAAAKVYSKYVKRILAKRPAATDPGQVKITLVGDTLN